MRRFMCPTHDQDWAEHPECPDCVRILAAEKRQAEVSKKIPSKKRIPYQPYWGNADTEGGRWINELTPEPVFVRSKGELRELMRRTNSMEK